ncbi:MAG: transpeptidase family protein [Pyrinomonadaceae bacterium]|nr:transpeptidase family protein [Pyrinomonadaceae bacterium]
MSAMLARLSAESKTRPDVSIRRALFVAAFIVCWMLAISVRLVYLQISDHDRLVGRAQRQQQFALETDPERGLLLDRHDRELARSIQTASIFVDPAELETPGDIACVATRVASVLKLDEKSLVSQLAQAKDGGRRFLWLARRLSADQAGRIRGLGLPGVHFRTEPKRFYPNGSLAAHVLGFVGLDGAGLGGVEQVYNKQVSGEAGKLFVEKDSSGNAYESFELPSKPGQTIVLTIDQSVQYRAEQALVAAVKKSRAKSGTAIVLDPHTGEILALANAPTFDPNNVGAVWPEARANWALQYIYEPGSTFKIVSFSAAIEKGLAKPEDRIDCQMGAITIAGRTIRDHKAFGTLTIAEALAKSSNVAAIKLGLRVGDLTMHEFITRFGFGSRTGIELPGETPGLLRPVTRWQASSIGSIAIGQEIGVTPLQMAAAFGVLANDGMRVAPHLVREILTSSGTSVYRSNPEQRRVVTPETARALRRMLEEVTLNGTAKLAQLDGYSAAGKTGTAQKIDPKTKTYSRTKHIASFVGFAPVENPAVVVIIVIDEPAGAYHGGDVAAPVFREIAEQILPDLGIVPDTKLNIQSDQVAQSAQAVQGPKAAKAQEERKRMEDARKATLPSVARRDERGGEIVFAVASRKAVLMPDLRGRSVRDVARACAQLGLQVEARGDGQAIRQSPAPGTEVGSGQVVSFDFARAN